MDSIKTFELKILNPDRDLEETMQKYAKGMNYVSEFVYGNGEPIASAKLQSLVYAHLREELGLKSQVSCNIPRQVAGTYKTIVELIKIGMSHWQRITYSASSMTLSYKRDFTIFPDSVSITTYSAGRKSYKIQNYEYALQYFSEPWKFSASKVVKHKNGEYYFHLTVSQEIEEKPITEASNFMGVDVGLNYLAVGSTTDKKCVFYKGRHIKDLRNRYKNLRARLQSKGTLSAKRVIKNLSDKEKRLMKDVNHCISKKIVSFALENEVSVISLEDITGIRANTVRKRKKVNRYHHSSWAYRQLQDFIEYKAIEKGISVEYVDPAYTSQACSRCNHIQKSNRKKNDFKCKVCGFELHSDLNAARNIENRIREARYILEAQGCLSTTQTNKMI